MRIIDIIKKICAGGGDISGESDNGLLLRSRIYCRKKLSI